MNSKWYTRMRARREARRALKAYGKTLYQARVDFVRSFEEKPATFSERVSYKYLFKRCIIFAVILTLTLSLCMITASALGINLFNMDRIIHPDNDEYRITEEQDEQTDSGQAEMVMYQPTYIPEGYTISNEIITEGLSKKYVYTDGGNYSLSIDISIADASTVSVDNEHTTMKEKVIDEKQVIIYEGIEEEDSSIYLMQEGEMLIKIIGILPAEEFEKIIYGLEVTE